MNGRIEKKTKGVLSEINRFLRILMYNIVVIVY